MAIKRFGNKTPAPVSKKSYQDDPLFGQIGEMMASGQEIIGYGELMGLSLSAIEIDPEQPRIEKPTLEEVHAYCANKQYIHSMESNRRELLERVIRLAENIKKRGLEQPVVVVEVGKGVYRLVAGERRYLAHMINGSTKIKAIVKPEYETAEDTLLSQIAENLQREALSTIDQLSFMQKLSEHHQRRHETDITHSDIEIYLDCGRTTAFNLLALLRGSDLLHSLVRNGRIKGLRNAANLARKSDEEIAVALSETGSPGSDEVGEGNSTGLDEKSDNKPALTKGRKPSTVTLGKTANVNVVKEIITQFSKDFPGLDGVDWTDKRSVRKAWDEFLQKLEERLNNHG